MKIPKPEPEFFILKIEVKFAKYCTYSIATFVQQLKLLLLSDTGFANK